MGVIRKRISRSTVEARTIRGRIEKRGYVGGLIAGLLIVAMVEAVQAEPMDTRLHVAQAVLPLPVSLRAEATIVLMATDGSRRVLREGTNAITCRADDPSPGFSVFCYHRDLEAYVAMALPILAAGKSPDEERDALLSAVKAGKLLPPASGRVLYTLVGAHIESARPLTVVYLPHLTSTDTGLPATPDPHRLWLMWEGTPLAHVMIPGK